MNISKESLTAAMDALPERDLVALVAFRGLVQAGDPQAGFRAYELADDFLAARDGNATPTDRPNYPNANAPGPGVNLDDDDLPF